MLTDHIVLDLMDRKIRISEPLSIQPNRDGVVLQSVKNGTSILLAQQNGVVHAVIDGEVFIVKQFRRPDGRQSLGIHTSFESYPLIRAALKERRTK